MKTALLITFGPFEPYSKNSGEETARFLVAKRTHFGKYWLIRESFPASVNPDSDRGACVIDIARRTEADAVLIVGMDPAVRGFSSTIELGTIDEDDLRPNGSDRPHIMSLVAQARTALKADPLRQGRAPWAIVYVPCTADCLSDPGAFAATGRIVATREQIAHHIEQMLDIALLRDRGEALASA